MREKPGLEDSGLHVSQIKRRLGLETGERFSPPESENAKIPPCPPEKEKAITDALKHFKMQPQREGGK
jgi:hypothetical protein